MSSAAARSAPPSLPETMRAVCAHTFGGPEVLEVRDIPRPSPGPGELLIRVTAASVNFADTIRRANGPYPFPTMLPFIPGSEVAGTVAALGDGVSQPPVGTAVFALVGTGTAMGSTGYAQFALAPATQVVPLPPGLDPALASTLFVAGLTAELMLRTVARVTANDTVLVHGAAGGVGAYAIQIARALGARSVIGAVSREERMPTARQHGADHVVCSASPDWMQQVRHLTNGHGADVVLEMRGGEALVESLTTLAPFGRVVVFGAAAGVPYALDASTLHRLLLQPAENLSVHAFNLGLWFAMRPDAVAEALQALITRVATGRVQVPVGATLPLQEAADAHRLMHAHAANGKLVLRPWA